MRATVHIAIILLVGVGLGLAIRSFRNAPASGGPGPNDVVFTDKAAPGDSTADEIEDPEPSRPPEGETLVSQFELTERSGKTINSDELIGHPYVVSFFFSTCPGQCTQQNQKLKELQEKFEGEGVRFVSISVDPETDTPEVLREYAARFGADSSQWLFMTGDLLYIRQIGAASYFQGIDQKSHTDKMILVDAKGEVEGFYSWPAEPQFNKLQESIRKMLDELAAQGKDA